MSALHIFAAFICCVFQAAALSINKPNIPEQLIAHNVVINHSLPAYTLAARERLAGMGRLSATPSDEQSLVCVSLPVFEDFDWIDELLANFQAFTERTTKVALHFNVNTDYDEKRMASYASDRVAVTKDRISIQKVGGSILYSHLLNAKTLEETWPGECTHFVMQASNMMWVRKGMETAVRTHRYSQLEVQKMSRGSWSGPFWKEIAKDENLNGGGQPEGAFFPMKTVHDYIGYMEDWLERTHQDRDAVLKAATYVEAVWLQTYALNFATDLPEDSVGADFSLCYRHMVEACKDYDKDSVPLSEVKDLYEGRDMIESVTDARQIPTAQYYAVKRVNRDLTHPTTKYIIGLAHMERQNLIGKKGLQRKNL